MSARTRYLQLSDTTMMEYVVNETTYDKVDSYIHTVLADGHHAIFSTVENEVVKIGTEYVIIKNRKLSMVKFSDFIFILDI